MTEVLLGGLQPHGKWGGDQRPSTTTNQPLGSCCRHKPELQGSLQARVIE